MVSSASSPFRPRPRLVPGLRINRHRRLAWGVSLAACLLSLLGMALSWLSPAIGLPLRPGLDFTGGTQIQIERVCTAGGCPELDRSALGAALRQLELPAEQDRPAPDPARARVQLVDQGRTLVLRLPALSAAQGQALITALEPVAGPLEPGGTGVDTIGPTLGAQLLRSSLISLLVSFAGIALFITIRYDRLYAGLALLCLGHDVLIICGIFAWLGLAAGVEVNSLFAVSLLTIAGYSVNDTVVVFDRIREQRAAGGQEGDKEPITDQVDRAVAVTLTRSIYTSSTTLLPLLALILFGGSTLFWFGVALAIGVIVGSWSSIAIAPTLLPVLAGRTAAPSAADRR